MAPPAGSTHAPRWLLDEVATAGRENLDPTHVSRYDTKEDASAAAEVRLCTDLGLTRESIVVDIGPGTGQFALAVAPAAARVIAVDVSPVMLERLRTKIAAAGVDNVEPVRAGFLTYEHSGQPADLIYSRYALHHLPDFWKALALARMHQILRPGGLVRLVDIVYSFEPDAASERLDAWCSTVEGSSADGWSRWELEEHIRDEHSTFSWLLEPMILRSGLRIEQADYSGDGIFASYVLRRP